MNRGDFREKIEEILSRADVKIDGDREQDIQVHEKDFYPRLLGQGSMGLGESYMDGWWDCEHLDEFFHRVLRARLDETVKTWKNTYDYLKALLFNLQKGARAYAVGERHYDIGNDLFECMLDRRMIYSCAYWKNAETLDLAQEAKLDLICRKLTLEPGMKVLDIGCGWGGTAHYMAEKHGAKVTGVTVSKQQAALANQMCRDKPVEIKYLDYRDVEGEFDRVVSVGMFEHVGRKNYRFYMKTVRRLLKKNGLFLLQTIGGNKCRNHCDPWLEKYIFPNSILPCPKSIAEAAENVLVIEDWQNFGADYDKTLMQWHRNFEENWPCLKPKYGGRFYRMWTYYLLMCAGAFRARRNQLWQIVMSPEGVEHGYCCAR